MECSEETEEGSRTICKGRRHKILFTIITAFVRSFAETGLLYRAFASFWRRRAYPQVPQCSYVEGVPDLGNLLYKQEVNRWSKKPHVLRFHQPSSVITGIACRPKDKTLPSPEAEVLEGGVNFDHVTLQLTPVDEGHWSCVIDVCGRSLSEYKAKTDMWQPNMKI
ncbi:hypothetical protein C0J52_26026 [Blattella germanica]|nr:hypothetical protein C0J52_26026 [Blattella germanica]